MRTFRTDINYIGVSGNVEDKATNLEITQNMINKARSEVSRFTGRVKILEQFDRKGTSPIKVKINLLKKEPKVIAGIMKIDTPALQEAYDLGILTTANYAKIRAGGLPLLEQYSTTSIHMQKCYESIAEELNSNQHFVIDRDDYDRRWRANIYKFRNRAHTHKDRDIKDILANENDVLAYKLGIKEASALAELFIQE